MTPVDGIIAPSKNKKNRPPRKKPVKKVMADKINNSEKSLEQESHKLSYKPTKVNEQKKHTLVWMISIIIVVIIFVSWGSSLLSGNLETNSNNNDTFFSTFTNELNDLWDKFQKDYLKIKESAEDVPLTEEERIKKLEEKVFPQFDQNN